ncbi:MAG TPA: HNH endonuclease domain-containing protein, partial [Williamwhitmania sp.]|nr:HNH endonuclease domain-containing protein [Williamwhitmania sp.]
MKKILGLDLGTNSVGWALIKQDESRSEVVGLGSRIIPMSQDILGEFDRGNSVSQTAERTGYRGTRRLRERYLLRRERLHRVLNILNFLPEHYGKNIDFEQHFGKFIDESEPKIAYKQNETTGKMEFVFIDSFNEMVADFKLTQPHLVDEGRHVPHDWTIFYLRKKALTTKIEKEELAWILLNFNQKRGYYQLRGEEQDEEPKKRVEFYSLKVVNVQEGEESKTKGEKWYSAVLENGWVYRRTSKTPLDWIGKTKDFIVTTDIDENGEVKRDKDGVEKRSFRAPLEDDWTLIKKKTEADVEHSNKTVGTYIYDALLLNPTQKIKGKLVRTIERKFYKTELEAILTKQREFHKELLSRELYQACLEELYGNNEAHRNSLGARDFTHLFLNDIIFYQRPLKSKKSLISNCPLEFRTYIDKSNGMEVKESIKSIAKSHPLYQEFRLWQFIQNLKIYAKEGLVDGKVATDVNITQELLTTEDDWVALFHWLNDRKEVDQKALLKYPAFGLKKEIDKYRWNYVEDKTYPCNETRAPITTRLNKVVNVPEGFLTREIEEALWHILYSVEDKHDVEKALAKFAAQHSLGKDFVDNFKKFPPFSKDYGSYSAKAIKKLLPLMRQGKCWHKDAIDSNTLLRIDKLLTGEFDPTIRDRVREKSINLKCLDDFKNLPLWLASYVAYDRHAEANDIKSWKTPSDVEYFLRNEFKQHSLRNPIVEQVITETLRVVKDIWIHYGKGAENYFSEIHIELGREMKNPADRRKSMTQTISENENTNLRIKALLAEFLNDSSIANVRPNSPSQQEILKIYEEGVISAEDEIPDDIQKISKLSLPTTSELIRYKLWLDQRYHSPYTGEMIPLAKLFTSAYEIEHVIPQSRYFDDSLSNKVICEAEVNKDKDNATAYEYIKNNSGKKIELSFGKEVTLFTLTEYEENVKRNFSRNRGKMKKLLMEEIPDEFIARQLNDSRYISKVVKGLLSNIVRVDDEQEVTSKNVIPTSGAVTSILKKDWGLNDVWNEIISPRFERLNQLTNSTNFGHLRNNLFVPYVPLELQKGFNRKRIDHRHHAMDALVIACATRNHVNYLNNSNAFKGKEKERLDLRSSLCFKNRNSIDENSYQWTFKKPWNTFTQDAKVALSNTVVSFKQNVRVINKSVNHYQKWEVDEHGQKQKVEVKQVKGDSWAIRKPMHKDTVSGRVTLRFQKAVNLSMAVDTPEFIVDKSLKAKVKELLAIPYDKKQIAKYFKENDNQWNGKPVSKVDIYYFDGENAASRVKVDETFNSQNIKKITDAGIQRILLNHLQEYDENVNGKVLEHPEIAFTSDGLEAMNRNIQNLNNGIYHQPIYKVRTYEPMGSKFAVGTKGNKGSKFVEAAKGTNLFFAFYLSSEGKRSYETVPLNVVIEREKQGLSPVSEQDEKGNALLFYLSPNDLVYVPTQEEQENSNTGSFTNLVKEQVTRVYKAVSFSGTQCFFVRNDIAIAIIDKVEFSVKNKMERSIDGVMIKDCCWKLKVDRLG